MVGVLGVFPVAENKEIRDCQHGRLIRVSDTNRGREFGLILRSSDQQSGASGLIAIWLSRSGIMAEHLDTFSGPSIIEFSGTISWEVDQDSSVIPDSTGKIPLGIGHIGYADNKVLLAAATGKPHHPRLFVDIERLERSSGPSRVVPLQFSRWNIWLTDARDPHGARKIYCHDAFDPALL
jgi:hypothetical protein